MIRINKSIVLQLINNIFLYLLNQLQYKKSVNNKSKKNKKKIAKIIHILVKVPFRILKFVEIKMKINRYQNLLIENKNYVMK